MNRLFKIIGALVVVILISSGAYAAESTEMKSSWSGVYAGAFAGYTWAKAHHTEPEYPGYDRDAGLNGVMGGVLLGYNHQFNSLVLGVEADAGKGDLYDGAHEGPDNDYSAFRIDWNAHLRARLGVNYDPALFYVAGGLALARLITDDRDPGWGEDSDTHLGWTIGTGVEYAMTRNLIARVEYLFDDYGTDTYLIDEGGSSQYRSIVDLKAHSVRIGLSYRF